MTEEIMELLKSINGGKIRGAKKKLAQEANVSNTTAGGWVSGREKPSIDIIPLLAKIFKRSENDIKKIFEINQNSNNVNSFNTNGDKEYWLAKIKLLEEKIAFLEDKVAFYKNKK